MAEKKRILIVGGGLAGICLTQTLLEKNVDVEILHSSKKHSSTEVATGMYNPIVFRRLNQSWMIQSLEKVFHPFYTKLSEELETPLLKPIHFFKRIPSEDYAHLWNTRALEPEYTRYLEQIKNGLGEVKQAGILDTKMLMETFLNKMQASGRLTEDDFNENQLRFGTETVSYQTKEYYAVILTRGAFEAESRLFGWLPFNICKGEWIKIKSEPGLTEGRVINNILNIIPEADGIYKLSSTYSWKELHWESTDQAAAELCGKFEELFDAPYEVIEAKAGLRPTVADRRPYLGSHPDHKNLFIFNGLGSKGVMLAPYFAQHLTEHILDGKPLMPEVDIQRHAKRYRALSTTS